MGFTIDGCIHRLSASHWERRRLAGAMRPLPTQLPAGRRRSQPPKPYRQPGEARPQIRGRDEFLRSASG